MPFSNIFQSCCQLKYLQLVLHEVKSLSFVSKVICSSCGLIRIPYRLYLCGRGIVFHCSHGVGFLVWFVGGTKQITKTEMIQLYNIKHVFRIRNYCLSMYSTTCWFEWWAGTGIILWQNHPSTNAGGSSPSCV